MTYDVCEINLKISPDRKPNHNPNHKPIHNLNPFPIPNPMTLKYDFSYDNQLHYCMENLLRTIHTKFY